MRHMEVDALKFLIGKIGFQELKEASYDGRCACSGGHIHEDCVLNVACLDKDKNLLRDNLLVDCPKCIKIMKENGL